MALTQATRPYVPGIRLVDNGTLSDAVTYAVPEQFLVPKDGVQSANAGLIAMFNSPYNNFRITKGVYLITDTLEIVFSKHVNVVCDDGVVFRLGNNVRKNMLHLFGDRVHNFSWSGGEIDGNWAGQGGEVVVNNHVDDVSHGFIVSRWNVAKIEYMFVHDCMGHHINHAGNKYFIAEHIRVDSHISTNFPAGGARGDGITGVSRNIYINDVSGYSSDDLIGVFPGATWIPGESDPAYLTVDSITVTNINPKSKADGANTRYTWHGVTGACWNLTTVKNVSISNVFGEVQDGGVRFRCAPTSGDDQTLNGFADHISIEGVHVYVNGKSTDQYETVAVMIGSHQQSTTLSAGPSRFKNVSIRDVTLNTSDNIRSVIIVGHVTVDNLNISDVSVNYTDPAHTASHLTLCGSNLLSRVNLCNMLSNHEGTISDLVMDARPIVRLSVHHATATGTIRAVNMAMRRNQADTRWIGTVLMTTGFHNRFNLFGEELVINAPSNYVSVQPAKGSHFTDRFLGRVRQDPLLGGWVYEDFCTVWESANFGRPSATSLPGYSLITNWVVGTVIKTAGSPIGEVSGWVCTVGGATPTWSLLQGTYHDGAGLVDSGTLPTSLTPGVSITTVLISSTGFPGSSGCLTTFTGAFRPDRAGAYQRFIPASGTKEYMRTWNNSTLAWNAWLSVTYA